MILDYPYLSSFLRRHVAAFIIAFCVGLVCVLPHLFQYLDERDAYHGVSIRGTDTEEYYLIRIREAYDGHYSVASPELFEYKNAPYIQPALPELSISFLARLFNISVSNAVIVSKFLFPFLLSLIWYRLAFSFTRSRELSLLVPPVVMLVAQTAFAPGTLAHLLQGRFEALTAMVDYTRPINPQFSSPVFFFWLLLWSKWLQRSDTRVLLFAGACLLGTMIYIYPYAWMLGMGIAGLTFLITLVPRFRALAAPPRLVFLYTSIALFVTVPYWLNYYHAFTHPAYTILQQRYGFYTSHAPLWSDVLFIGFVLTVILFWRKTKDASFLILVTYLLSLFLLTNQQVITGFRFYPGHWHWYYTTPLVLFLCTWALYIMLRQWRLVRTLLFVCLLAASFTIGVAKQTMAYEKLRASAAAEQRFAPVLQWISSHTYRDDVIMSNGILNELIPIYTSANAYFSRWGEFYLIPHERFRDRMYARLYLDGADASNIDSFVTQDRKDVYEYLFGRYQLRTGACGDGCFAPADLARVQQDYLLWHRSASFVTFLSQYRLDYAVWDTQSDPLWNLDQYDYFKFITEIEGVRIYRFDPHNSGSIT